MGAKKLMNSLREVINKRNEINALFQSCLNEENDVDILLGLANENSGDFSLAIRLVLRAIDVNTKDVRPLIEAAYLYLSVNDTDNAMCMLERAKAIDGGCFDVGMVSAALEKSFVDQLESYRDLLNRYPGNETVFGNIKAIEFWISKFGDGGK